MDKYAEIFTFSVESLDIVKVEASIMIGLPSFNIIGLPSKSIKEAEFRIRMAFNYCGVNWPKGKIIVNLQPSDQMKSGTHYDLPIAIAILKANNQISCNMTQYLVFGEIALNGSLLSGKGYLTAIKNKIIIGPYNAKLQYFTKKIGIKYYYEKTVGGVLELLNNNFSSFKPIESDYLLMNSTIKDKMYLRGQQKALRYLTIACAGFHNILMIGSPGVGKSLLAQNAMYLLPELKLNYQLELHNLYDLSTVKFKEHIPYRNPHSNSSIASIIGGGSPIKPGEVSLSHRGILHLDEISNFSNKTIESLRDILENKQVTISRTNQKSTLPADFMLILTANPCKCGYGLEKKCKCKNFFQLSGPIANRIDIKATMIQENEDSQVVNLIAIRQRISKVQKLMLDFNTKYQHIDGFITTRSSKVQKYASQLAKYYQMNVRSMYKMWKIALTISLYDKKPINQNILLEATEMMIDKSDLN